MSDSLRRHESQHSRPPCPSPTPRVHPKRMSTVSMMPSNHLSLCRPLLLLLSIFPNIRVFSSESALHIRWPKYWSFSFTISPSNEHPGLISFRMVWLDLHVVQGILKRDTCTPMFIAALFIIARTWKQPRCPSANEWIRKLWYIYTMEYYSAIKKNSFESVLMRWTKLEPIIQSEVSQKDKQHYNILTHIHGI